MYLVARHSARVGRGRRHRAGHLTSGGGRTQIPKLRLRVTGQAMGGETREEILELGGGSGTVAAMRQRVGFAVKGVGRFGIVGVASLSPFDSIARCSRSCARGGRSA